MAFQISMRRRGLQLLSHVPWELLSQRVNEGKPPSASLVIGLGVGFSSRFQVLVLQCARSQHGGELFSCCRASSKPFK